MRYLHHTDRTSAPTSPTHKGAPFTPSLVTNPHLLSRSIAYAQYVPNTHQKNKRLTIKMTTILQRQQLAKKVPFFAFAAPSASSSLLSKKSILASSASDSSC